MRRRARTLPLLALALGTAGSSAVACSAVLGIDGDYVEGGAGGMAGAANGGSGPGANGGTHSGGGASSGGAPATGGGGGSGSGGQRPLGAPCTDPDQCEAGRCVDDVCCNNSCSELCESCDQAGALGECTPIPAGDNPDGDCDVGTLQACTEAGTCKGLPGAPCSNNGQCLSGDCNQQSDSCD